MEPVQTIEIAGFLQYITVCVVTFVGVLFDVLFSCYGNFCSHLFSSWSAIEISQSQKWIHKNIQTKSSRVQNLNDFGNKKRPNKKHGIPRMIHSLKLTWHSPWNWAEPQKETIVPFQPSIFRGELIASGRVICNGVNDFPFSSPVFHEIPTKSKIAIFISVKLLYIFQNSLKQCESWFVGHTYHHCTFENVQTESSQVPRLCWSFNAPYTIPWKGTIEDGIAELKTVLLDRKQFGIWRGVIQ